MSNPFIWTILGFSPFIFALMNSFMFFWMILEISSIMFISVAFSEMTIKRKEILLTYFLTQSVASALFLISIFHFNIFSKMFISENFQICLIFIMFVMSFKMAMAPLHFWIIKISKSLSWNMIFMLLSWQKLVPLMILMKISIMSVISLICLLTLIIGVISQLKILYIKLIIVFSSMGHLGWMLFPLKETLMISLVYLFFYSLILIPLLEKFKWENLTSLYSQLSTTSVYKILLLILSLSGIPPLMGFMLKWISLKTMIFSIFISLGFSLMACISFFIYIRMAFKSLLSNPLEFFSYTNFKMSKYVISLNLFLPTIFLVL